MMSKTAKKNYVEEMKKNFSSNESVMIAQYQGLNVNELDELRKELREKGILFKITKNRITKIAIKETPVKDLEKYFTGPTAAAISSDGEAAPDTREAVSMAARRWLVTCQNSSARRHGPKSSCPACFGNGATHDSRRRALRPALVSQQSTRG